MPIAELAPDPSPEPEVAPPEEPELEPPDPEIMALLEEIVPIEHLAPDAPPMEDFTFIKAEAIEAEVEMESDVETEVDIEAVDLRHDGRGAGRPGADDVRGQPARVFGVAASTRW